MLKHLNQRASRIFAKLAEPCGSEGEHHRYEVEGYMPLTIERLQKVGTWGTMWSLMHTFQQNGDTMRDPDIEFYLSRRTGRIYPTFFKQDPQIEQEPVHFNSGAGECTCHNHIHQADIASFCNDLWFPNISEQFLGGRL